MLRISKVAKGQVNFNEYKSCMLASLRSLLPKDWSTGHEVAWSWLWENVERLLQKNMGNPPKWEKALSAIVASFDENQKYEFRKDIYSTFFAAAPAGQADLPTLTMVCWSNRPNEKDKPVYRFMLPPS